MSMWKPGMGIGFPSVFGCGVGGLARLSMV